MLLELGMFTFQDMRLRFHMNSKLCTSIGYSRTPLIIHTVILQYLISVLVMPCSNMNSKRTWIPITLIS